MKREIIKVDEEKCNGCGLCIPNCHEGALQIIDGKARLISDLMCDGLGACIGHCPEGAMEIEVREAGPYDEAGVMEEMVTKGRNVVTAHMKHLKDHGEFVFLKQAVGYLMENDGHIGFPVREVIQEVHNYHPEKRHSHGSNGHAGNAGKVHAMHEGHEEPEQTDKNAVRVNATSPAGMAAPAFAGGGGCPGSRSMSFGPAARMADDRPQPEGRSELAHWPVQMHLINPQAAHFKGSDLLLSADCVAYAAGNFHGSWLKGKTLAIACPKLDSNKEIYIEKLVRLIGEARINTITVMKMEVPCCSGIEQMALMAVESAGRKVPVKIIKVSIQGEILDEYWI